MAALGSPVAQNLFYRARVSPLCGLSLHLVAISRKHIPTSFASRVPKQCNFRNDDDRDIRKYRDSFVHSFIYERNPPLWIFNFCSRHSITQMYCIHVNPASAVALTEKFLRLFWWFTSAFLPMNFQVTLPFLVCRQPPTRAFQYGLTYLNERQTTSPHQRLSEAVNQESHLAVHAKIFLQGHQKTVILVYKNKKPIMQPKYLVAHFHIS